MTGDCRHCTDYRECVGKDGYLFADLRFCPFQVVWILENSDILHIGKWPMQYSVYDKEKGRRVANEGYFVKPAVIIAEVEKRLETTGKDGKLLVSECKRGVALEDLDNETWEVLMYVKGWWRKKMDFGSYQRWKRWKNKQKVNKNINLEAQNALSMY